MSDHCARCKKEFDKPVAMAITTQLCPSCKQSFHLDCFEGHLCVSKLAWKPPTDMTYPCQFCKEEYHSLAVLHVHEKACSKNPDGSQNDVEGDDLVEHPAHYGGKDNPYETIKVLEAVMSPEAFRGFCVGNAWKYLSRAGKKDPAKLWEDLEKAHWYLNYLIERGRTVRELQEPS